MCENVQTGRQFFLVHRSKGGHDHKFPPFRILCGKLIWGLQMIRHVCLDETDTDDLPEGSLLRRKERLY